MSTEAVRELDDEVFEVVDPWDDSPLWDWHGCAAVRFSPEKMGGRATVGEQRFLADDLYRFFLDGDSLDEIVENYGLDRKNAEEIVAFASERRLKAVA